MYSTVEILTYFSINGNIVMHFYDITGSACCTNNKQIAGSVSFSVFTNCTTEELLVGRHLRRVTRTRIQVIGVNFSEILIKERKLSSS